MNSLTFLIARTLRLEAPIASLGMTMDQVMAQLEGSVNIVGNARGLTKAHTGAEIDSADLVVRINRAPMPAVLSHGRRTDILCLATSIDAKRLNRLNPHLILWMSHKRKRLPWAVARHSGFALPPIDAFVRLKGILGAPPTTGLMMIDLISRSAASKITLYGFDFFASLSLSGRRTAIQVPHNFAAERAFVETLLARDQRFRMHDCLTYAD